MLALADVWEARGQVEVQMLATHDLGDWRIKKTPDSNPTGDGQNIRDIERDRTAVWRQSILDILIPHMEHFKDLAMALTQDKPVQASHDLFGITRHTTLANLCRGLQAMRKLMPDILPWDAQKIGALFDKLRTSDAGPDRPLRYHNIVKKLNQLMGGEEDLNTEALKRKKDKVREELCLEIVHSDK